MTATPLHRSVAGFDHVVSEYQQARPEYPADAVRWMLDRIRPRPGRPIADLAAGTGKLTSALVAAGATVVAVEPLRSMGAELRRTIGGVPLVAGVAEALPLGDASLEAVTVGQGMHWFANPIAVAELHRVIRPGGSLGLAWNRRDSRQPLNAALDALLAPHRGDTPSHATGEWRGVLEAGDRFGPMAPFEVPWVQPCRVEDVVARVASVSFVASLGGPSRSGLLAEVRRVASLAPAPLVLSYVTDVFVLPRAG